MSIINFFLLLNISVLFFNFFISDFFQQHKQHRQQIIRPFIICTGKCNNKNGITNITGINIHDDKNANGQNIIVPTMYTIQQNPTTYTYMKLNQFNSNGCLPGNTRL